MKRNPKDSNTADHIFLQRLLLNINRRKEIAFQPRVIENMSKQLTFSRLFENVNEREPLGASFDQNQFIELLSKHKALLVQSKDGEEPL